MSRKVQVDQRKVGDLNSQCLSFFFIFLLLKKKWVIEFGTEEVEDRSSMYLLM